MDKNEKVKKKFKKQTQHNARFMQPDIVLQ